MPLHIPQKLYLYPLMPESAGRHAQREGNSALAAISHNSPHSRSARFHRRCGLRAECLLPDSHRRAAQPASGSLRGLALLALVDDGCRSVASAMDRKSSLGTVTIVVFPVQKPRGPSFKASGYGIRSRPMRLNVRKLFHDRTAYRYGGQHPQRYLQVIHNRNGRVARIIDSQNPANPARARRIADEYRAVGPFPTIPQDCAQQEVGHTPVYTSTGSWCCRVRVLGSFSVGSTFGSAAHCRGSTLRCEP
jgi:hypothetical protein